MEEKIVESSSCENSRSCEEKPKIRLTNVPKFFSTSVLRKAVADHLKVPIDSVVCRKGDKWNFALLSFKACGPLVGLGIQEICSLLQDFKFKKYEFGVKLEAAKARPVIQADAATFTKSLNDQVTPLWNIPYEDQLARKQSSMSTVISNYFKNLGNAEGSTSILDEIRASPLINGYRNKCEFTFGWNKESRPTVGFSLGGFKDGVLVIENASNCLHVPDSLKSVANFLESYLSREGVLEKYPLYNRVSKTGFWRILMAREHGGAVMIALQVQDDFVEDKEAFKAEMAALIDEYNQQNTTGKPVESVYVQFTKMAYHGMSSSDPYVCIPPSKSVLVEKLAGLSFQISPSSFFQVNRAATEVLYEIIRQYTLDGSASEKKPVLLDVCCGTGTIGMIMAADVSKVIGVEMVESAIEDAKLNTNINGITNIEFKCARVEAVIKDIIAGIPEELPIVVVLDPPRSGVHADVIKTLRSCLRINRIVFVACNPVAALTNFMDLSRPTSKSFQGLPFKLDKALPVDMFPHTEHCELVLQFNRHNE